MLYVLVLPTELTLSVLSYLPIPSLLSLPVLSRQWLDFFTANQSAIFHSAALLHEYIQPGTLLLEDALSMNTGRPWAGSTSWNDFCHRSFQLRKNWEGEGRAVARVLTPPGSNVYGIKVDEKAGICITTHFWGGLSVIHLFSSTVLWCLPKSYVYAFALCEYDNGYLVFGGDNNAKEVWRLASDLSSEDEFAAFAPPNGGQMRMSALAARVYHQYAPRGQFRPWALLPFPYLAHQFRLAYPTLVCATHERAFLYDVRTGSLVQAINICLRELGYIDVNERHVFVCGPDGVHVFSRESGDKILQIPAGATVQCSQRVEDPFLLSGDKFVTPLSVSPRSDEFSPRLGFIATHVSKDGRDLVVLWGGCRVVLIQNFERICRGESSLERAGLALSIQPGETCCCLSFEHGRVCVATLQGLYIFTFSPDRPDLSVKAAYVRPTNYATARPRPRWISGMQLTDRRLYFMLEHSRRRQDIPLFEDAEDVQELPPTIEPTLVGEFLHPPWDAQLDPSEGVFVGCIDFTLMPENDAREF